MRETDQANSLPAIPQHALSRSARLSRLAGLTSSGRPSRFARRSQLRSPHIYLYTGPIKNGPVSHGPNFPPPFPSCAPHLAPFHSFFHHRENGAIRAGKRPQTPQVYRRRSYLGTNFRAPGNFEWLLLVKSRKIERLNVNVLVAFVVLS